MSNYGTIGFNAEHRNERVRAVLLAAAKPLGPTEIATLIGESWCCYGEMGCSAPIVPVCRRIGAIGVKGKYTLQEVPA